MKKTAYLLMALTVLFSVSCKQKDKTPPNIFLIGDNPIIDTLGTTFEDSGATADDNFDGSSISSKIEVTSNVPYITGSNRTKTSGDYYINYVVADKAGNETVTTRDVKIINSSAKYAVTYQFSKEGGTLFAPNFFELQIALDYDNKVNNRIFFTKLSNIPSLRIYGDIINDSLIVIERQRKMITNNNLNYLFEVTGIANMSLVVDNIFYTIVINYQIEKYEETTPANADFQYEDKYWRSLGYDTNKETYVRL